ncbi:TonB-dependent receptor [Sphingobacterium sp. HMA12]|jgi:iron complex outermembrane receptor protein|uniref:TonB-dependent receptor n=1 Tax=Sphingobacterium sp. HMA12 TaxID=2050894 RepID=UPI000CE9CF35|nr:TonB-dependent receptor [Sphingobacterium sp. HMA12]
MKKRLLLPLLGLGTLSLGYAQKIQGYIKNGEGKPITGATITFANENKTKSDENGFYSIFIKPGTYQGKASYLGRSSELTVFSIQSDEFKQLDFQINEGHQLDEVVVVANRRPTSISDVAGTVWLVNSEQIQQQAKSGVPIKEMLGLLIPGMDVGPQGRTNYGQNMRGRSMLVMIDGVSLNSLRGISRQLDAIDPFNIERIEVLSGANSIYGGNATGGIINIITKKASKNGWGASTEAGVRSGLRHSGDADWRIAQSVQAKGEKIDGRLAFAYQQNGATYGADNKQIFTDISQTDLQYNRSMDLQGTLNYRINPQHKISIFGQYYDSKFNGDRSLFLGDSIKAFTPGNGHLLEMRDGFKSSVDPGTKRWMGTLNYTGNNILGGQDLYLQVASRAEKIDFYPFPNNITLHQGKTIYTSSSRQNTDYTGMKLLLSKEFDHLSLSYGADLDFEKFKATQSIYDIPKALASGGLVNEQIYAVGRYPTIKSRSLAGYIQAEYQVIDPLKLSAGIRYQNSAIDVADFIGNTQQALLAFGMGKTADQIPGGKSNYGMTTVNASALYKINAQQQTWLSYSEGVALADPAKYFGYGTYKYDATAAHYALQSSVNIAEAKLQGVKTNQFELGYRLNQGDLKVQLSGFVSQSNKSVESDRSTYQILVKDNPIRNIGIEAQIDYKIKSILLGANTLVISSKNKINGEWLKQDINYASSNKINVYAGYSYREWSTRLQMLQILDLKDADHKKLKGYNAVDWFVTYTTKYGRFNAGVQNLLNTKYQSIWSQRAQLLYASYNVPEMFYYQGRGRTFTVNYSIDF